MILCADTCAQWQPLPSRTTESLRGLSVFNQGIIWASGTHGTYLFTSNGGETWTAGRVPGAESLDFRGVISFGPQVYLLAAGPGEQSRIYHTGHFGDEWQLQFTNRELKGFFDCMAFSDSRHGIVVGDPVDGKFRILLTNDGGVRWRYSDPRKMPPAVAGEGAFAASNSCITVAGRKNAWFVTGGAVARVFRSTDGGHNWKVSATPIVHGEPSTGIFSVAFRDAKHGVIAGGDYAHPERGGANLAMSDDGGKTWKLAPAKQQRFFSAVTYVSPDGLLVAGSGASGLSRDGLRTWQFFSPVGFNVLSLKPGFGVAYAAGANGSVARTVLGSCQAPCEPGGGEPR